MHQLAAERHSDQWLCIMRVRWMLARALEDFYEMASRTLYNVYGFTLSLESTEPSRAEHSHAEIPLISTVVPPNACTARILLFP